MERPKFGHNHAPYVLMDGSCHAVQDSIDLEVWRTLGSRDEGKVLPGDWGN